METQIDIVGAHDPPPWTDVTPTFHTTDGLRWAIIQGGMQSRKPSVAIAVPLAGGQWVIAEMSYELFDGVAGAFRGALARWEAERAAGNGGQV